jgi:hypothetical protein
MNGVHKKMERYDIVPAHSGTSKFVSARGRYPSRAELSFAYGGLHRRMQEAADGIQESVVSLWQPNVKGSQPRYASDLEHFEYLLDRARREQIAPTFQEQVL